MLPSMADAPIPTHLSATPVPVTVSLPAGAKTESPGVRALRLGYRAYRNGSLRVGHSLLRRMLARFVRGTWRVTLRSGLRMELDLSQGIQNTIFWYDGDVEPQLTWAIREFLPMGGRMVDCGANCGLFGLESRLHRQATVRFVEPHPTLGARVLRNIQLNGWEESCRLVAAAASDHRGRADLFLCDSNDGSHSLHADWPILGDRPSAKVEVALVTLEDVLRQEFGSERIDFLKIDTEGHDFSVLRGLGDSLAPNRVAMLYLELGNHREAAMEWLKSRGYSGFAYRRDLLDGVALRRAMRRAADGQAPVLYTPFSGTGETSETLWCGTGSAAEQHLLELAARNGIRAA